MSLKTQIQEDMKAAMRARDSASLSAIRLLIAAIKQREIDERRELDGEEVIGVIEKLVKQRREAAAQYEAGNRPELAAGERFEVSVLSAYLPAALTPEQIEQEIDQAMSEADASSIADMGKVMALFMPRLAGKADMADVSGRVRARLAR